MSRKYIPRTTRCCPGEGRGRGGLVMKDVTSIVKCVFFFGIECVILEVKRGCIFFLETKQEIEWFLR